MFSFYALILCFSPYKYQDIILHMKSGYLLNNPLFLIHLTCSMHHMWFTLCLDLFWTLLFFIYLLSNTALKNVLIHWAGHSSLFFLFTRCHILLHFHLNYEKNYQIKKSECVLHWYWIEFKIWREFISLQYWVFVQEYGQYIVTQIF